MPDKRTEQPEPQTGTAVLRTVLKDSALSAVPLRNTTLQDGTVWATFSAYMREEQIADLLDQADPGWEWKIVRFEEIEYRERRQRKEEEPIRALLVMGELRIGDRVRTGVGCDPDPRAAATYAFKDAAQKWGVGRFLAEARYTANAKFASEALFKRFISSRPSWADVVELTKPKKTNGG